jgi:hypothetical protein
METNTIINNVPANCFIHALIHIYLIGDKRAISSRNIDMNLNKIKEIDANLLVEGYVSTKQDLDHVFEIF